MLEEGNIIRFDPFYFKNGNTAKPKYFLVIKHTKINTIIATLPTRKDTIPENETIEKGCIDLSDINLNCYVIPGGIPVTVCGKKFDFTTHLYGHQLDDYSVDSLNETYPNEGSDYEIWGKMKSEIFLELIECFKNSKSVKWKYRNQL
jgi:hypothetical protein